MSWIQKLYETYDNCQAAVGADSGEGETPLLPICHTTQKAQVEISLDGAGHFLRAGVVPKAEGRTIIPCTEQSSGRGNVDAPHALNDKLQYVAADYPAYGGKKRPYHVSYRKQLEAWCASPYSHPKARAVLAYIQQGHVVRDLVENQILLTGADGKLLVNWEKKKDVPTPPIFEVSNDPSESFIRWRVEIPGDPAADTWRDPGLWEQWTGYYIHTIQKRALCMVTGQPGIIANLHPAKIRNDGDKAKLISSNDTSGYTFRGRFTDADQAATVGYEVTQKAHLALRWLIRKQGYSINELSIVAWATSGAALPQPLDDTAALLGLADLAVDEGTTVYTAEDTALRLNMRLAGYSVALGRTDNVVVMAVNSATIGRLSITYYQELTGSDFLERVNNWHTTCAWTHTYRSIEVTDPKTGKKKKRPLPFSGAPAPADIAEAAYGPRVDDRLKQTTITRLLPCIIDGAPLPRDLVESAVRRACNRAGSEYWEWNKTLTIACALYRKYNRKETYSMALDPDRKTRDYLYGRLLALAESLEEWALNKAGEKRETNAARLMQRFADHPFSTWRTIELALTPSKARLGGKSFKRQRMIDEVIASFQAEDFTSDKPLSGEFLLGYHCQRESLRAHAAEETETVANENE